jgi:hypothetical protein
MGDNPDSIYAVSETWKGIIRYTVVRNERNNTLTMVVKCSGRDLRYDYDGDFWRRNIHDAPDDKRKYKDIDEIFDALEARGETQ